MSVLIKGPELLKIFRVAKLSQRQAAQVTCISRRGLREWIHCNRPPSPELQKTALKNLLLYSQKRARAHQLIISKLKETPDPGVS